jgi:tRNA-binding EMAP/Myf-like protein
MARCSHCQQRKAKRFCPALGSPLCPLCCGRLREKELHCPPGCPYLSQHKPYQESRVLQKKGTFSAEVLNDDRLAWLILNIEASLKDLGERKPGFIDKDAILALEYAKSRVEKGQSMIVLAKDEGPAKNDAGEAILQSLNQCRYQRKIILPQNHEMYNPEEKIKCLENTILAVKHLARGQLEGRAYLQDIERRLARLQGSSGQNKIITST